MHLGSASAGRHLRESLSIFSSIGHRSGEASSLSDLGQVAVAAGRWTEAETHIANSKVLADELDDDFIRYRAHVMRADMCRLTRRWRDTVAGYERALKVQRDTGINGHGADILEGSGETAAQLGETELAAELLAAGLAWRRHYQLLRPSFNDHGYAAATTLVQRTLSPETWRQALDTGAQLSPGSVEDVAAAGIKRLKAALEELTCGLSERQVEVLRLVAQGLSNADIAEQLVLSPRTVQTHLRSVFNKLGVTTRTAAAHEAVQLGLN